MRKTWWIAAALALLLVAWMASGLIGREAPPPPQAPGQREREAPRVQVRLQQAEPVTRELVGLGESLPDRTLVLRAETGGTLERLHVRRGARVEAGAPVAQLSLDERSARLREAQALLRQRQQEFDATRQLAAQGFVSQQRVRDVDAQLEAARANVQAVREELGRTRVVAPFTGIVNAVPVEAGQALVANAEIAVLLDIDPLQIRIDVAQQHVQQLRPGAPARVAFITGEEVEGRVSFVSASADSATRTFQVEVQVPNPALRIPAGVSAEVRIPVGQVAAHRLSPALLSLDDQGRLGVKTVDDEGRVQFHPVDIVRSAEDGIWVAGLPERIRLITRGQAFVQAGEAVRIAPAEAAPQEAAPAAPSPAAPPADARAGADDADGPLPAAAARPAPGAAAPAPRPERR